MSEENRKKELERVAYLIQEVFREENLTVTEIMAIYNLTLGALWQEIGIHAHSEDSENGAIEVCNEFFEKTHRLCLFLMAKSSRKESKNTAHID